MPEHSAVRSFIEALRSLEPVPHVQRCEDKFSVGVPDLNVCHQGKEIWFEIKWIIDFPRKAATGVRVPFRPQQPLWADLRTRAGGDVRVLTRVTFWGWAAHKFTDVDFRDLADGTFNKEHFLDLAYWSGPKLNIQEILE